MPLFREFGIPLLRESDNVVLLDNCEVQLLGVSQQSECADKSSSAVVHGDPKLRGGVFGILTELLGECEIPLLGDSKEQEVDERSSTPTLRGGVCAILSSVKISPAILKLLWLPACDFEAVDAMDCDCSEAETNLQLRIQSDLTEEGDDGCGDCRSSSWNTAFKLERS
jgi:hypothetical protein